MKRAIVLIAFICMYYNTYSQKVTPLRKEYINAILNDTDAYSGKDYYLLFKVKLKNNDTIQLCITENEFLVEYFQKRYGWNTAKYIKIMKEYLLYNKVMVLNEDEYFNTHNLMPLNQCKGMYDNIGVDSLVNLYRRNSQDSIPVCLMWKCFLNNILFMRIETKIEIANPIVPRDIDPYTGLRKKKDK